ncbi:MAG TPA: minor capsid protein [Steroidobacter sp.]|uniref:minor capsid protein n=1 Tax=Steroidobacter sp. TaxID=1978227 RepID=UPI002ED80AE7
MAVSAVEIADAFLRQQVLLLRVAEGEREKFLPFLREMYTEIRDRLAKGELTEFSRARLERQLKAIDVMLDALLADFQSGLLEQVEQIAVNEAEFASRAMARLEFETDIPAPAQIRAAVFTNPLSIKSGSLLKPFVEDWTAAERRSVTGAIRRGVFQGQTNAQIVQAIRGTKAARYQDGLLDITARNARTIVHTAVQHASTQARQSLFESNADIVKGVQWISTLDSLTCQTCRSLDQRIFPRTKGPRSPIHPFCRCTMIPYLGKQFDMITRAGTRASIGAGGGKQVAATLDYYSWLKLQPRSFIEVAIGRKRAQLFLDGGLSVDRFAALQLDRRWEPLTLEEMKRLEPLAFERAGLH